jgi:hypothetical protein
MSIFNSWPFHILFGVYQILFFLQRKMENTGSQVYIKEEMEEDTKDILSLISFKEEDPFER